MRSLLSRGCGEAAPGAGWLLLRWVAGLSAAATLKIKVLATLLLLAW